MKHQSAAMITLLDVADPASRQHVSRYPHYAMELPIEWFYLDPTNANDHPEDNLDAIQGSMVHWGQVEPILVQGNPWLRGLYEAASDPAADPEVIQEIIEDGAPEDKRLRVIGGNGRLVVARRMGWTGLQCVVLEMNDDEVRKLGLDLNASAKLSVWNLEMLAQSVSILHEKSMKPVGFTEENLSLLLCGPEQVLPKQGTDAHYTDREVTGGGVNPAAEDIGSGVAAMRMIQIPLTPNQHDHFMADIEYIRQHWTTETVVETVRAAVQAVAWNIGKVASGELDEFPMPNMDE